MTDIALAVPERLPMMSDAAVCKVRTLEDFALQFPQTDIPTSHVFHAGMYSRTIMIPAGIMLTGALIKIATLLVICGDVTVYIGDESIDLHGYKVLPADAHRKQAFLAHTDTYLTMLFPTSAASVEEAEIEFTDEAHRLISRKNDADNQIVITGV